MSTNPYFAHNNPDNSNEQDLLHGFTSESIQMRGYDFYFLPRQAAKVDDFFGEDVLSNFSETHKIEMYIESADGFEGQGDMMSMFGILVKDQASLVVAQRRFREVTGTQLPLEGDLIFFPFNKALFEIKFVDHEHQFYPLGTLPAFSLRVELFDYSHEDFDTGIEEIDDIYKQSTDEGVLDELDQDAAYDDDVTDEANEFIDTEAKKKSIWGEFGGNES